jgi:hypothetical protein
MEILKAATRESESSAAVCGMMALLTQWLMPFETSSGFGDAYPVHHKTGQTFEGIIRAVDDCRACDWEMKVRSGTDHPMGPDHSETRRSRPPHMCTLLSLVPLFVPY